MDLCAQSDECAALLSAMKMDVSPGGQYAATEFLPLDNNSLNNEEVSVIDTDPTSIFYKESGVYAYQDIDIIYADANGQAYMVRINGEEKKPNDLSPAEFITYWNPAWATVLAQEFHPEYCYYEWCISNSASNQFDQGLYNLETLADAIASGFIDANGQIGFNCRPVFSKWWTRGGLCSQDGCIFESY